VSGASHRHSKGARSLCQGLNAWDRRSLVIALGHPYHYREWCLAAALINAHATVTLMTDGELKRMGAMIWRGCLDPTPPWYQAQPAGYNSPNPSRRGRSVLTARQCGVSHSYP
jgi:hypothetical protein